MSTLTSRSPQVAGGSLAFSVDRDGGGHMPGDLIVFGPPGVGKGTQCAVLGERFGYRHLSTGDLIRSEIRNKSDLGLRVEAVVRSGALVSDELLFALVDSALRDPGGLLFDGFPRSPGQAAWLAHQLEALGRPLLGVVALAAPDDEIVARLSARRSCASCGAGGLSQSGDEPCAKCGGRLVRRADDEPSVIARRLLVYRSETAPVLDLLARWYPVHFVDGRGDVEVVTARIAAVVGLS
jgi:adenylate kinase